MLNDDQLFLMGKDSSTTSLFHMYMINFSTNSYSWANTISCSAECSYYLRESIQSSDNSKIYSLFLLELNPNAYFIVPKNLLPSRGGGRFPKNFLKYFSI